MVSPILPPGPSAAPPAQRPLPVVRIRTTGGVVVLVGEDAPPRVEGAVLHVRRREDGGVVVSVDGPTETEAAPPVSTVVARPCIRPGAPPRR
jgi:hypothetical protein